MKIKFWSNWEKSRQKLSEILQMKTQCDSILSTCASYLTRYPVLLSVFKRLLGGFQDYFDDYYTQYESTLILCSTDLYSAVSKDKLKLHLTALKQINFISNEELLIEFYLSASEALMQFEELNAAEFPPAVLFDNAANLFVTVSDIFEQKTYDVNDIPEIVLKTQSLLNILLDTLQSFVPVCMSCSNLIEKFQTRNQLTAEDLIDLRNHYESESSTFLVLKSKDLPKLGAAIVKYLDIPFRESFWELKVEASFLSRTNVGHLLELYESPECETLTSTSGVLIKEKLKNNLTICEVLIDKAKGKVNEFNSMTDEIIKQISVVSGSTDSFFEFYSSWNPVIDSLKTSLEELISEENNIRDACLPKVVFELDKILKSINEFSVNMSIMSSLLTAEFSQGADPIISLSYLTTQFERSKLPNVEIYKPTEDLLNLMRKYLDDAQRWQDKYGNLMPLKATRKKTKVDTKQPALTDIELALTDPILRVVKIPLVDTLQRSVRYCHDFKLELLDFLLPSENGKSAQVFAEFYVADNEADDELYIHNLHRIVYAMHENISLVNINLNKELEVLTWAIEIMKWLEKIPNLPKVMKSRRLRLSSAKLALQETAAFVVENVSSGIKTTLLELGVLEINEDDKSFYSIRASKIFEKLYNRIELLKSEISRTEEWDRMSEAMDLLGLSLTEVDKSQAEEKYLTLNILPDRYISEISDEKVKKRSVKQENAPKKARETKYNEVIFKEKKKADKHIADVPTMANPVIEVAPPKRHLCAAKNCVWDVLENSSFCSDLCAVATSEDLLDELLSVRRQMSQKIYANLESIPLGADIDMYSPKPFLGDKSILKLKDCVWEVFSCQMPVVPRPTNPSSQPIPSHLQPSLNVFCAAAAPFISRGTVDTNNTNKTTVVSVTDIRAKVANSMEEVFVASLERLGHSDPVVVGSVLASEVEEELYNRYDRFGITDSNAIKLYRKHQLYMIQNFRKPYNDALVSFFYIII